MWNANVYDRHSAERMQPAIDLARRIKKTNMERILDVGCGSGVSTAVLASVWKDAWITGVDQSGQMLKKAQESLPFVQFIQRGSQEPLTDLGAFDLIFVNDLMQWMPDPETFLSNAMRMLKADGALAAQIPLFEETTACECVKKAESSMSDKFRKKDSGLSQRPPQEYYDMLAESADEVTIWSTEYYHPMKSHKRILEFLKSTALRPHMEILSEYEQITFMAELLKSLKTTFPCQEDGLILFPFKRLFLLAEKTLTYSERQN